MTEIEAEQEMSRSEVAEYLREFAAQLDTAHGVTPTDSRTREDSDGRVTFMVGNDSATINPPDTVEFEVSIESDDSILGGGAEQEVEFELSWKIEDAEEREDREYLEIK